jgi:hypothetical protein
MKCYNYAISSSSSSRRRRRRSRLELGAFQNNLYHFNLETQLLEIINNLSQFSKMNRLFLEYYY